METTFENIKQFVIFKLEEQFYGIDIQSVQIIERMKSIMRVPKAPHCIKGVMNLRGEIIPVIDVRAQFELEKIADTDDTRIIIVKVDETMVGIIVDSVKEVVELRSEQIESVQNVQGKMNANHILGIGKLEHGIMTLLNLKNIVEEAFELSI
ncbi:MAG: chemotaxis protein CheW [Cellulosilyticaceae bacterium]